MPGIAHGLASVCGSRRYGQNSPEPSGALGSVANWTVSAGSSLTSGTSHGSEPLASEPSERSTTGVR